MGTEKQTRIYPTAPTCCSGNFKAVQTVPAPRHVLLIRLLHTSVPAVMGIEASMSLCLFFLLIFQ